MESIALTHFLATVIVLARVLVPVGRILRRAGFSTGWCILAIVPVVGLIGLWVFAFIPWPSLDQPAGRALDQPPRQAPAV